MDFILKGVFFSIFPQLSCVLVLLAAELVHLWSAFDVGSRFFTPALFAASYFSENVQAPLEMRDALMFSWVNIKAQIRAQFGVSSLLWFTRLIQLIQSLIIS